MAAELKRYCLCGGSMSVKCDNVDMVVALDAAFGDTHSGDGHGPATAKQAAKARAREDEAAQQAEAAAALGCGEQT